MLLRDTQRSVMSHVTIQIDKLVQVGNIAKGVVVDITDTKTSEVLQESAVALSDTHVTNVHDGSESDSDSSGSDSAAEGAHEQHKETNGVQIHSDTNNNGSGGCVTNSPSTYQHQTLDTSEQRTTCPQSHSMPVPKAAPIAFEPLSRGDVLRT